MAVTTEHSTSERPRLAAGTEFSSRAAAEAYVGGVCFKQGPPALLGAELEWLTSQGEWSAPGHRPELAALVDALGPYAPQNISPGSPGLPLPGGSRVTLEPGGQIELSSAPYASAGELCTRLRADTTVLRELLATRAIRLYAAASDPHRPPHRVLELPRYRAMEEHFAGIGPFGTLMMCNTAATQVSVDAGSDPAEIAARWTLLYAAGPALLAAFACSPTLYGVPAGPWASQRMRTWLRLDHARTRPPVAQWSDPVTGYAHWALDVPLLCVRRAAGPACDWTAPPGATFADWLAGALDDEIGRRPTSVDLDYHLTTLFPPVRATGHLEVRYLDAQPGHSWTTPVHTLSALLSSPAAIAEATALAAPTAGSWWDAARDGLADPQLRAAAVGLLQLAATHTPAPAARAEILRAALRCRAGQMPAADAGYSRAI